jgi:hypothetical protein
MPDGVTYEGVFGEQSSAVASTTAMGAPGSYAAPSPGFRHKAGERQHSMGRAYEHLVRSLPSAGAVARTERKSEETMKQGQAQETTPRPSKTMPPLKDEAEKEAGRSAQDSADTRTAALQAKLAPELRALLDLKGPVTDYSQGKVTVKDGKTAIQVWLTNTSDEVLSKLKEKGLDISFSAVAGKMVIGVIAVDKLAELVEIPEITRIEPLPVG